MTLTLQIFCVLVTLLITSRALGELALRFSQPALVGELCAGILLGTLIGYNADLLPHVVEIAQSEGFMILVDLGVFFLMLFAGIVMHPRELTRTSVQSFSVAVGGMVLPLLAGSWLGWTFLPESDYKLAQTLFVGVSLSITAVPVAVAALLSMGRLNSRPGKIIVSAAVFDDVFGIVLLAVLVTLISSNDWPTLSGVVMMILKVGVFFGITVGAGRYVFPWAGKLLKRFHGEEREFSALLIAALSYAILAELMGMHFILGPFVAGLFFSRGEVDHGIFESVKSQISGISSGFLTPVFFASIGMRLDLSVVSSIPVFLSLLILAAILSKLIGAGIPALLFGLSPRESLAVGVGMSARGAVELVVADLALRAGLFSLPSPPRRLYRTYSPPLS